MTFLAIYWVDRLFNQTPILEYIDGLQFFIILEHTQVNISTGAGERAGVKSIHFGVRQVAIPLPICLTLHKLFKPVWSSISLSVIIAADSITM